VWGGGGRRGRPPRPPPPPPPPRAPSISVVRLFSTTIVVCMAKKKYRKISQSGNQPAGYKSPATRGVVKPSDRRVPIPGVAKLRKEVAGITALQALRRQQESTSRAIKVEVKRARRAGVSWREIGEAFGMSQQWASKEWGPYPVKKPRVGTAAPGGSRNAQKAPQRRQARVGV
jgi:hypothetical protein